MKTSKQIINDVIRKLEDEQHGLKEQVEIESWQADMLRYETHLIDKIRKSCDENVVIDWDFEYAMATHLIKASETEQEKLAEEIQRVEEMLELAKYEVLTDSP